MTYSTLPDHFYVSEMWDSTEKVLVDVPNEARFVWNADLSGS